MKKNIPVVTDSLMDEIDAIFSKGNDGVVTPEPVADESPLGCLFPECPDGFLNKCSSLFLVCPATGIDSAPGLGSFGFGGVSGIWHSSPKSYDIGFVETQRRVLSDLCSKAELPVLSESIHINARQSPYVFVRTVIGDLPGFKRGVTLQIGINPKDSRVWVLDTPRWTHTFSYGDIVIGDGGIMVVDFTGDGRRYPADERLAGTFIEFEHYPYTAMPMEDAVLLCKAFKVGTVIRNGDFKKRLRMAKELCGWRFGSI